MAHRWIGKSEDGNTITLRKLKTEMFKIPAYYNEAWATGNTDLIRNGAVIDVETTGLDQREDKVIEIGLRLFQFNRSTGEVLHYGESYSAFQDPGFPLSPEIITLTGITDEVLKDQKIDWDHVNQLLKKCQIVIAHNASFDRPFIDALASESPSKIWGCSFKQVGWHDHGFSSQKLDVLSIYHGFFTDAHRALNDSDALLYLLSHSSEKSPTPYLFELLNNARKPTVFVSALYSPFETKDLLKARQYRWEPNLKSWVKEVFTEQKESEIQWLEEVIYQGKFKGKTQEIQPVDHFKLN